MDFPPRSTVFGVFTRWRELGVWDVVHDALRDRIRIRAGRKAEPTAAIIDSQSVRAAETVGSPVAGRTTNAGLPKRVPSANLVPGSIGTRPRGQQAGQAPPSAAGPARSPDEARARLKGFQVRGREGRTDAPGQPGTNEN